MSSLETFHLDAVRFQRVLDEVEPRGIEKLHFLWFRDDPALDQSYRHLLATLPSDRLIVIERGDRELGGSHRSDGSEAVVFICPTEEHRDAVAQALVTVLHLAS